MQKKLLFTSESLLASRRAYNKTSVVISRRPVENLKFFVLLKICFSSKLKLCNLLMKLCGRLKTPGVEKQGRNENDFVHVQDKCGPMIAKNKIVPDVKESRCVCVCNAHNAAVIVAQKIRASDIVHLCNSSISIMTMNKRSANDKTRPL